MRGLVHRSTTRPLTLCGLDTRCCSHCEALQDAAHDLQPKTGGANFLVTAGVAAFYALLGHLS